MSRQMRRHPVASGPPKQRPIRPTLRATKPAAAGNRDVAKRGLAGALRPTWVNDVYSELRKVQWPTPQDAWNLTVVVLVVCIVVGVALGLIDYTFSWIIQHTLL